MIPNNCDDVSKHKQLEQNVPVSVKDSRENPFEMARSS